MWIVRASFLVLAAILAEANPNRFDCSRSMAVGATQPMDSASSIHLMADRAVNSVGGVPCDSTGALPTGVAHRIDFSLPSNSYEWLMEGAGVTAQFSTAHKQMNGVECVERMSGKGTTGRHTVTFLSTGTVSLRVLASNGFSAAVSTGLAQCSFTVTNVDECTVELDNCDSQNAVCIDTDSSFACQCNPGWNSSNNGVACSNADECTDQSHNCDSAARCTDTPGSFTCACNDGWSGNGVSCTDIDECASEVDNCDASNGQCSNSDGSFSCTCGPGWTTEDSGVTCIDANECTGGTNNCNVNAVCGNTVGSFLCGCSAGWTGSGVECENVDECATDQNTCLPGNVICVDTEGSFECRCRANFEGDGTIEGSGCVACNVGFGSQGGVPCLNVDECTGGNSTCVVGKAACQDTVGTFTCSCNIGYIGSGVECSDVNECTNGSENCDDTSATCENTDGSFNCPCAAGLVSNDNGVTCLPPQNECANAVDNCDQNNAVCADTEASFVCTCATGWVSPDMGVTCANIDECAGGLHTCATRAECTDTNGSFVCRCNAGYAGNGSSCVDADECGSDRLHNCDVAAACTNNVGSFTCACPANWTTPDAGVTCDAGNSTEVFRLRASTTLEGMALVDFDQAAEDAFKAEVVKLMAGRAVGDVRVTSRAEVTRRRKLLAAGVRVEYEVAGFESDEAVTAAATQIRDQAAALVASLKQNPKFSTLTGISTDFQAITLPASERATTPSSATRGCVQAWAFIGLAVIFNSVRVYRGD